MLRKLIVLLCWESVKTVNAENSTSNISRNGSSWFYISDIFKSRPIVVNNMQLKLILAKQTLLSMENEKRESVLDVARRVGEDQLETWALFCALMAWG